ncbi:hypothetical protein NFHSH190041_35340 [Shewanella sp. NFH-SH190041]|uniref:DUF2787 domain-containing protein n=1 Tax=Shewanella sp. NFH-SH190041 TaxID=2950245 RepID=UPI0021C31835|nr:DUF2787 domain-containing protein [Shewanella sp. NFH-SH190041]BDM66082.1 hypothetical protein NFHSH190041_35340 [Shewanella sp. NFH-SH190041]
MKLTTYSRLRLPEPFYQLISHYLEQHQAGAIGNDCTLLTINFRDPDYSVEDGGYHPVEIGLTRHSDNWQLSYVTDFAWCGGQFPELVKELDICFSEDRLFNSFFGSCAITQAAELINTYLENFVQYHNADAFQVEITTY